MMKPVYKCDTYVKTSGCYHNKVDGEELLRVTLRSLKHQITRTSARSDVVKKLSELARRRAESQADNSVRQQINHLKTRINTTTEERPEVGEKLAVEKDPDLQDLFRSMYQSKGELISGLEGEVAELNAKVARDDETPEEQVRKALKLLDQLEQLVSIPEARKRINEVLRKLGIWIGLDFHGTKWGKREVRRIKSGMISIGGYHLPVPLHGGDNCDPNTNGGDCGCSTGPDEAAENSIETPGDGDAKTSEEMATSGDEGDSYTKVSRGDTI